MSKDGITLENLQQWQRWLMTLENGKVDEMKSRILRTAALRIIEYLHDLTPVRTGRLVDSYSMGDRDNVYKMQIGRISYVFVGTAVSYAKFVNDGFQQKPGQFVPGYWKSGTFHYDPDKYKEFLAAKDAAKGTDNEVSILDYGMVLTGKVIPGARMFEKAIEYVQVDMMQIFEFECRRLYNELFAG